MTTLNSISYNPFKPTRLKVVSLGVGLTDETNDSLRLTDDQRLLVAERLQNVGSNVVKTYGLIVDEQGIAVNTTIPERADNRQQYAMYVDGSIFVTGAVIACNVLSNANGGSNNGSDFWKLHPLETENIYYDGKITLGNQQNARRNAHLLNMIKSADRNISNSQISIQNLDASQLRMGIIGTLPAAPVIFNTSPGTPMEFHASRTQTYFSERYRRSFYENGSNIITEYGLPTYDHRSNSPHLLIDSIGNIGIHTSACPPITYEKRIYHSCNAPLMIFPKVTEPMNLHIDGPMFACNIIMYDFEEGKPENIDRLFVRRKGVTFEANQVIPGPFAYGNYYFQSNLGIAGEPEDGWELKVNGSARITDKLQVDNEAFVNLFTANDAILLDIASFCNDVYMNRDLILKESLRIRGGIYTEVVEGSNVYWCNVQFQVANPSYQNININGNGITTPGKFGVGIDPTIDEVNNMIVIRKNSATIQALQNFYELELMDRTDSRLMKTAYIGHPNLSSDLLNDGSLIFATPSKLDANYNRGFSTAPQNFYFYPGSYTGYAEPFVRINNPPTLNAHSSGRVGIKTFDPQRELDVAGDITFSKDIYQGTTKMAIWKDKTFPNIYTFLPEYPNPTFRGIEYNNPIAPNVGVNSPPDPRYGMTVTGKLRSIDGYYTGDNRIIVPWMDSLTSSNIIATSNVVNDGAFVMKPVGVGIPRPTAMLDVKQTFGDYTTLRLTRPEAPVDPDSTFSPKSRIEFAGTRSPWVIQADDLNYRLEIANTTSNSITNNSTRRGMIMQYDPISNRHQTILSGDLTTTAARSSNSTDSLIVDGGVTVIGNMTVTGSYRINATVLTNSNIEDNLDLALNTDDVFIGGNRILMNPNVSGSVNGFMGVGFTEEYLDTGLAEESARSPFRVYQSRSDIPEVARFIGNSRNALIELFARNANSANGGNVMKFGLYNGFFTFMDGLNRPFLNFNSNVNILNERYLSFGGYQAPTAAIHIQTESTGANMLRLSRIGTASDSISLASELELEKRTVNTLGETELKRWIVRGPDASFEQKLSFVYGETGSRANDKEMMCFTKTNCIGIGNTHPVFALDVASTSSDRGTLRLWSSSSNPTPQLVLQSGSSLYGGDSMTDYRIYAYSNEFYLDSVNQDEYSQLLHFNNQGHLGIGTSPTSNYQVNIAGVLNVKSAILLDGNPLFDTAGSEAQSGFYLRAINIFIKPQQELGGGVVVNGVTNTTNLFHIFAGKDANMMVYDSYLPEAQVHYRATTAPNSLNYNMYRMGSSNQKFIWKHMPNSSNVYAVSSSNEGYSNVIQWGPSSRTEVAGLCNYDMELYGSAHLISTYPQIRFGPTTNIHTLIGNTPSTNHLFLLGHSSNIGIGTTTPVTSTHIWANNSVNVLQVEQNGTGDIARFVSNSTERIRVANNGYIGIGTTVATDLVHIHNGSLRITGPSATTYTPSLYFTNSITTGIVNPLTDTFVIQTASAERIRVMANGNVGIGTTVATTPLHVHAANTTSTLNLTQSSTGDILRSSSSTNTNILVVNSTGTVGINTASAFIVTDTNTSSAFNVVGNISVAGNVLPSASNVYDLGASNLRWKDLYLSGNTLDIGGTKITRVAEGYLQISDGLRLSNPRTGVVIDSIIMPDNLGSNTLTLKYSGNTTDPLVYVLKNTYTGDTTEYVPFAKSDTSGGISVGVDTAEALLHLANPVDNQPTAIFEQTSSVLSDVLQVRGANQERLVSFQNDGNVGIGTTIANFPLHIVKSNTTAVTTIHQKSTGDILKLESDTGVPITVASSGFIGIGTTTPQAALHNHGMSIFNDTSTFNEYVYMARDLEVQGNSITHGDATTDSDRRLKTDLQKIENALEKVSQLTGYTFMKHNNDATPPVKRTTGLIAQEVQSVLPEVVYEHADDDKTLSVAYGNMMGLIVEAIKELKEEVRALSYQSTRNFDCNR